MIWRIIAKYNLILLLYYIVFIDKNSIL